MSLKDSLKGTPLAEAIRFPRRLQAAATSTSKYAAVSSDRWKLFRFLLTSPVSRSGVTEQHEFRFGDIPFAIGRPEWHGVREVLLDGEYSFVAGALEGSETPVVLDLGANAGAFPIFLFSLFPKAAVSSFEPSGRAYALLEKNRSRNPQFDWKTTQAAIWKEDGRIAFQNSEFSTGSRIAKSGTGNETVPAVTLGSVLSRIPSTVDLLKMDIEGAEEDVLVGNEALLAERVRTMVVEIHPGRCSIENVIASLRRSHEHLYFIFGRAMAWQVVLASQRPLPFLDYRDEYMQAPPEDRQALHHVDLYQPGKAPALRMA
ncbi:MAG: FkbM family methyltransferase [Candidatus Eisenbacteria bacterium]